jgi:thymidylate synthase ThyX
MAYKVQILADSLAPSGKRLTTFELTYPRFVHSEFMTHRMFSRNAASSRAIPIEKMIERVTQDPAMPVHWGKNQKGMQAEEELDGTELFAAKFDWLVARDNAVESAEKMLEYGVHKQIVNRLLEPWMWITVICSATEYGNFFNLRCHKDAQPEIRKLADMMAEAYFSATPKTLEYGQWHTPLIMDDENLPLDQRIKVSVGRCARVSYLTHDGKRDIEADIQLHDRLAQSGHWSPFEHVAMAANVITSYGNLRGFRQYRKDFANENRPDFGGVS